MVVPTFGDSSMRALFRWAEVTSTFCMSCGAASVLASAGSAAWAEKLNRLARASDSALRRGVCCMVNLENSQRQAARRASKRGKGQPEKGKTAWELQ